MRPSKESRLEKRRFSLGVYLCLVLALSWPLQLVFVFGASSAFDKYLFSSLAMVMVSVATYIAGRFVFRDGFGGAGWHWGKPRHYIAVLLFAAFLWLVPGLLELAFGLQVPVGEVSAATLLQRFLMRFSATLLPAFGEEFGWRGYLLPRLAARYGAKNGLVLHAFVWWCWHLPVVVGLGLQTHVFTGNTLANVIALTLLTLLPSMLHAVIFAAIWGSTRSLAVATVYHAAFDEVRDTWENTVGFGPLAEGWQMGVIILVGALLLWKGNWDLWLPGERPPHPAALPGE